MGGWVCVDIRRMNRRQRQGRSGEWFVSGVGGGNISRVGTGIDRRESAANRSGADPERR